MWVEWAQPHLTPAVRRNDLIAVPQATQDVRSARRIVDCVSVHEWIELFNLQVKERL